MPCFKGLSVSVHAEGSPLPEYSIQQLSKISRITTYIPVPEAKVPNGSIANKPEPAKFAISITLLTPGIAVPYSTPKPTPENPHPRPIIVGERPLPTERGHYQPRIEPYVNKSTEENETIAAYIYFDGRAKEEVATLLRPGEETWVNSRWVQIPQSEGGGLAEREFLFKEVGLERWLNGLDLIGQDAAHKLEKRKKRFEKRQRVLKERIAAMRDNHDGIPNLKHEAMTIDDIPDDDSMSDNSGDEDVPPEATGQIKIAMFRVQASGDIKRGEYSPQFDAHDDDDMADNSSTNGKGDGQDIDHTTSFAKPKTLDPKSISTQTVIGMDEPDKPYAVFTFFYRGARQLQKMGIMSADSAKTAKTPTSTKRRSTQLDFGELKPLNSKGTVGFSTFRDQEQKPRKIKVRKGSAASDAMNGDSDEEDDDDDFVGAKMLDVDDKVVHSLLSPEDVKQSEEIAGGVGRIKLKRVHSADLGSLQNVAPPQTQTLDAADDTSKHVTTSVPNGAASAIKSEATNGPVASPFKKAKASLFGDVEDFDEYQRMMSSSSPGSVLKDAPARSDAQSAPATMPAQALFTWGASAESTSASSTQVQASQTALPDDDEEIL